jgi:hypothetical protein
MTGLDPVEARGAGGNRRSFAGAVSRIAEALAERKLCLRAVEMTRRGNRGKLEERSFPPFPPRLGIRQKARDSHSPDDRTNTQ